MEQREQQFSEVAEERGDAKQKFKKVEKASTQPHNEENSDKEAGDGSSER